MFFGHSDPIIYGLPLTKSFFLISGIFSYKVVTKYDNAYYFGHLLITLLGANGAHLNCNMF